MSQTTAAAPAAPSGGMQRIPMTLDSYQHQSTQLSSRLLLNTFAEQQPPVARSPIALLSSPGLVPIVMGGDGLGAGPVHAMNDTRSGVIYLISGTHLYLTNVGVAPIQAWTSVDLGDVGTPVDPQGQPTFYTIAVGANGDTMVCSPPNIYLSRNFNQPVVPVTSPWQASSVAYLDGYFVFTRWDDPTQFFITTLGDPTTIDPLDFASLDSFPAGTYKVEAMGANLWFAGADGWQIWYDAGSQDFPFRPVANGVIKRPVGRTASIAQGNKQLFWWSFDNRVYATVGYQDQRISTHAIERVIMESAATITQAYCYTQFGHIFYVMNLPDQTLVYDTVTQVWHNRSSGADGSGPWRPTCAAQTDGAPFMGDSATPGRLLQAWVSPTVAGDLDFAVKRQIVLPPLYTGTYRAFCSRLEIEMEVGGADTPGDILLEWSDDGGITYTGKRTMNAGTATQTRKRVYTTRLGSFRNRVFRLTSQHAMSIYAIDAAITVGNS